MLELAILYRDQLQRKYKNTLFDERYRYFSVGTGRNMSINFYENTWEGIQLVSVDDGDVVGYFTAKFNRLTLTAYEIEAINFYPSKHPTFTQDIANFWLLLFNRFGMNRIIWSVVVGNPAEKMYDRLAELYNERIVGVFKNDLMLSDGKLYDLKFYEVLREDFFKAVEKLGATVDDYRYKEVYVNE